MRVRVFVAANVVAIALALVGAGGASAATKIGDDCVADGGTVGTTLVQLEIAAGRPLPLTAPTSGVVTSWGLNFEEPLPPFRTKIKILRSGPGANEFTAVAEDTGGPVQQGSNSFATRLPIQAGDRLGNAGPAEGEAVFYCQGSAAPGDSMGGLAGDLPIGATQAFPPVAPFRLALWASIEPDADGDGYGDETQDSCPQSAALQTPCPLIVLSSLALAKRGAAIVYVATDSTATVKVQGTVALGKGKKATLKAKGKTVKGGKLAPFKLKFSKALKQRLAKLPKGKKLTLKVTATATNLAGKKSRAKTSLKLSGNG